MADLLQYTLTGVTVGMVYSLIAMGFVLIWKSSGVANLALGQLVLLFSWLTYSLLVNADLPVWFGMIVVILLALVLGWLIERVVLRPLIAQPILSLIAVTLGLAYLIEGAITFIWPRSIDVLPEIFPQQPVYIGSAVVSQEYLWAAGISLLLFTLLSLYFKYNRMGIAMRATADDQMRFKPAVSGYKNIFSLLDVCLCHGCHWRSN
jgi:branched-chain amino acid transport system permease protein